MSSLFHSEISFHIHMASTAGTLIVLLDEILDFVALAHPPVHVFRLLILGPAKSPLCSPSFLTTLPFMFSLQRNLKSD